MPRKNRKFTENEKDLYRLGFLEGEAQLRQTINAIKAANKHLMDELLRLDFDKPVLGDPKHVTIKIRVMKLQTIIEGMRKKNPPSTLKHYAKVFQKLVDKHEEQQQTIIENLEKNLE